MRRFFLCSLLFSTPFSALAAQSGWLEAPYEYVVINQDLRGALAEFGRNLRIPVLYSDRVRGRIKGNIRATTAAQFLEGLADGNNLTWYFDGAALHIATSEESTTEVVNVGRIDGRVVVNEMRRLHLMDERFVLEVGAGSTALRISGPPAFVAMVRQVIATIQPPRQIAGDDPTVRVFRGSHDDEVIAAKGSVPRLKVPETAIDYNFQPANPLENQEN